MSASDPLKEAQTIVKALRTAPSPLYPLKALTAQHCIACGATDLAVCRYPAFRSRVFAGQILCQCGTCGLSWVPDPEIDLDAFYSAEYAQDFDSQRLYEGPFYGPANPFWDKAPPLPLKRARAHAAKAARFGPFRDVFDLGAGPGFFLHAVAAERKFASELDPYAARILTEELGVTLEALGDRAAAFDLVMASHVLEHFTYADLPGVLAKVRAALRPGGVFFIEVPFGAEQMADFQAGQRKPQQRLEPHTLFFSSDAMLRLLCQAGFEIVEAAVCSWSREHVAAEALEARLGGAVRHDTDRENLIFIARRA